MSEAVLDPDDDLTDTDRAILAMLRGGRVTASFVADEQGKSLEYVRQRLVRLEEHNHVEKVHRGLYELVDDPEV